ncbi:MAG: hypothetical protein ACI8UG_001026 [Gammaproteobacteria bacterium]|jgi:hypothetical protein
MVKGLNHWMNKMGGLLNITKLSNYQQTFTLSLPIKNEEDVMATLQIEPYSATAH